VSKSPQIEQLNQALQDRLKHRQVNVLVDQYEDRLNVLLIKQPGASVSYPGLMEVIKSQIKTSNVPNIAQVKVLGLLQGHESPEWEQIFPLVAIPDSRIILETQVETETKPKPELHPLETPEALPHSPRHKFSKIWSIGLGIAAVFAIGYGLGMLNHGISSNRSRGQQEQNSLKK
jgi:hypothetical protein